MSEPNREHENPILVFIKPNQFNDESLKKIMSGDGEAGVTDCGVVEQAKPGQPYCLLLHNDEKVLPAKAPCKITGSKPLLIVAHKSSTKNCGPWENIWGVKSSRVCKYFSNHQGDPVFDKIRSILKQNEEQGNAKAETETFVQPIRNEDVLGAIDGIAAVHQIYLLDPDNRVPGETKLNDLNSQFRNRDPVIDEICEKDECDYFQKLDLFRERANGVLGIHEKANASTSKGC